MIAASQAQARDAASRAELGATLAGPRIIGLLIILAFAAVFFVWGALAPLQAGAIAAGQISPEGSRRTVQHLEGGIISELLVADGSEVAVGDPLIVLAPINAQANVDIMHGRHLLASAKLYRLRAEQSGAAQLEYPAELQDRAAQIPDGTIVLDTERVLFERRATLFSEQRAILDARIDQLNEKIDGFDAQMLAQSRRRGLLDEEIAATQELVDEGLAPRPRLLGLQREQASIDEAAAALTAAIAESRQQIGETQIQLQAMRSERLETLAREATMVQSELMEVARQLDAGNDVLTRTIITAPVSGRVTNLVFVTVGGVISPGAPIMDIVPEGEPLVIEARLSPLDVDSVFAGMTAQVHLPALPQRGLPQLEGEVLTVSADAMVDQVTGASYYEVRVRVTPETLALLGEDMTLTPGMPADIVVVTGERTLLEYLTAPIRDSMRHALKET